MYALDPEQMIRIFEQQRAERISRSLRLHAESASPRPRVSALRRTTAGMLLRAGERLAAEPAAP